jgi:hypothetical protein
VHSLNLDAELFIFITRHHFGFPVVFLGSPYRVYRVHHGKRRSMNKGEKAEHVDDKKMGFNEHVVFASSYLLVSF